MNEDVPSVSLLVTCIRAPRCDVAFEPEGAVVVLEEGDVFRVEVSGGEGGPLEISYWPNGISLNVWPGANTKAWDKNGDPLDV